MPRTRHPDRERVLARLQGIQKAAPFVDIFLDVISLRSGDRWAETIREQIRTRDVLYLFWSQAATESHHVETEWRTALAEHGARPVEAGIRYSSSRSVDARTRSRATSAWRTPRR